MIGHTSEYAEQLIDAARHLCCCLTGKKAETLSLLADAGRHNVTDLYQKIGISQSVMSQFLNELRQAGLVVVESEGTKRFYAIDHHAYTAAVLAMNTIHQLSIPKK